MGRPKAAPAAKRSGTHGFKLTPAEEEALAALVAAFSNPIPVKESDVIRHLIGEACRSRSIQWPGAARGLDQPAKKKAGRP